MLLNCSRMPMAPPLEFPPPVQVLPLGDAPNAEWATMELPWMSGYHPRSAVVQGLLHVVTYKVTATEPQFVRVGRLHGLGWIWLGGWVGPLTLPWCKGFCMW